VCATTSRSAAPFGEEGDLVGRRDGGGVDLERARPRHLAVRRLGRELDAAAAGLAGDAGHLARLGDEVGGLFGADVDRGGEAHGTVVHDSHAHAEVGAVRGGLGLRIVQAHDLAADALDAQLGRLAPRRGAQRGVGQRTEFVGGERGHVVGGPVVGPRGGVGWRTGRPAAK
jgi:hypothetical protein